MRAGWILCAVVLAGCGAKPGADIAGAWKLDYRGQHWTLIAKADGSFQMHGNDEYSGRWDSSGDRIRLFRDIRNGGDTVFGTGGDGSQHLILHPNGTMTGVMPNGDAMTFKRAG